jgi:HSP20 family protein
MSSLIRYASPITSLSDIVDDLFGSSVFSFGDRDITNSAWPRVDIAEDKDNYTIKADLPGLAKDDISINVENNVLTISGEKREEKREHEKDRFYHYERSYGKFSRSFNLPEDADVNTIDASYTNGVLALAIKKNERAKPKAIEVKVN